VDGGDDEPPRDDVRAFALATASTATTTPTDTVPLAGLAGRLWVIVLVTALADFAIPTVAVRTLRSDGPALPATPTAWLDAFSAGVARDSGDVCSRLLSPASRSAMERDAYESCNADYARTSAPDPDPADPPRGATAALEIRYWLRGGYSTFGLNRQAGGWQAVAIVPGGPLPIA
jgi:hypothetical protein